MPGYQVYKIPTAPHKILWHLTQLLFSTDTERGHPNKQPVAREGMGMGERRGRERDFLLVDRAKFSNFKNVSQNSL